MYLSMCESLQDKDRHVSLLKLNFNPRFKYFISGHCYFDSESRNKDSIVECASCYQHFSKCAP